jgi:hypothetical protein
VTRSTRTSYTSDRPAVDSVSSEGIVSAIDAGKAKFTVKCDDKTIVLPVVITPSPAR